MKDFRNKVAAITGAGSGMGRTLALALAGRGCHVAISDVNEAGLAETVKLLASSGVKVTSKKVNVANRDELFTWADEVVRDHGKCNLIFNNAGVALGTAADSVSAEDFQWIMGINFWGVIWGTQAFMPHLRKTGDGHVINISSLFGLLAMPSQSTYNSSKFAVRGYTEALRLELDLEQCGVSATCVHPGGIRTNIARAAKQDGEMAKRFSIDEEKARRNFDKTLNLTSAESAAEQMLRAVEKNKRRVLIGLDAKVLDLLSRFCGSWYQAVVVSIARMQMKKIKTF